MPPAVGYGIEGQTGHHVAIMPEALTGTQRAIASRIDQKARAIAESRGRWDADEVRDEMAIATPHEWTEKDHEFYELYLEWRRGNPT